MGSHPASYYPPERSSQILPEPSENGIPRMPEENPLLDRNPSDRIPDPNAHGSQQLPDPEVNGLPDLPPAPKSPYSDYYGHTEEYHSGSYPERSSQILPDRSEIGIPPMPDADTLPKRSPADQLPHAHDSQQLPDPEVNGLPDLPPAPHLKAPYYGRRLVDAAGAEPVKTATLSLVAEAAEPTYITDHAAQVTAIQKAPPSYDMSGYFGGWATVIKGECPACLLLCMCHSDLGLNFGCHSMNDQPAWASLKVQCGL